MHAYGIYMIIEIVCVLFLLNFIRGKVRTTQNTIDKIQQIEKFKESIETVNRQTVESLTANDHNYFYEILPYAYALKIDDIWINKFKNVSIPEPLWLDENIKFSNYEFGDFMNTTFKGIVKYTNKYVTESDEDDDDEEYTLKM